MTTNEFFRGLLAALAVRSVKELPAGHADIHRAFFYVLEEIRKPEMQAKLGIEDLIEIDYDPLYGQSRWFDRALTRAQRDHIISVPNPSYDKINIKYAPETGRAVLDRLAPRDAIADLADLFARQLKPTSAEQVAGR
jgi:hypothetical protein